MNYAEVSRLLLIIFITCFLLVSFVTYIILEFLYRWKKIGIRKIWLRTLIAFLTGLLAVAVYFFFLAY